MRECGRENERVVVQERMRVGETVIYRGRNTARRGEREREERESRSVCEREREWERERRGVDRESARERVG